MIRDTAHCVGNNGKPLPGVAPVAEQQGRYVADLIERDVAPDQQPLFVYADRGMLAPIGRA
jgi:NADH dehydrogenase